MSFTEKVKKEIIKKGIKSKCCKLAFLAGLIRGSGSLYLQDGKYGIEFKVELEEVFQLVSEYLKTFFDYEIREVTFGQDKRHNKDKIQINVFGEKAIELLMAIGVLEEKDSEYEVILNMFNLFADKECCLKNFFRGLFLSIGNCIIPSDRKSEKGGYHAEIVFSHSAPAYETLSMLSKTGVQSKITRRKGAYVVYIKSAEQIKNLLAYLGCSSAVFEITDLMITREITNNSNRQKNCDLGNLNRQVTATTEQINAINKIMGTDIFKGLKEPLKKVALARIENPEDSSVELAEKLGVTKSCLMHRLRKLIALAQEI